MLKAKNPSGFRDMSTEDMRKREYVLSILVKNFERYGFEPVDTPVIEFTNVLTSKYGNEPENQIFNLDKNSDEEGLSLRYDLTVPLARYVAQNDVKFPFKRYQVGKVYRGEKAQSGRYREFTQCDIDIVGVKDWSADVELLLFTQEALRNLGFIDSHFKIRINNRQTMEYLCEYFELELKSIYTIVDKQGKDVDTQSVINEIAKVSPDTKRSLIEQFVDIVFNLKSNISEIMARIDVRNDNYEVARNLISSLNQLQAHILSCKIISQCSGFEFDITLMRGISYYTGIIFEIEIDDYDKSVGGGGRYDNLTGLFMPEPVSACGMSFGLDRLIQAMELCGCFPKIKKTSTDVLIAPMFSIDDDPSGFVKVYTIASTLRLHNINVDIYSTPANLKKKLGMASSKGIPYVIIIGQDEINTGTITLKDMDYGTNEKITLDEAIFRIAYDSPVPSID